MKIKKYILMIEMVEIYLQHWSSRIDLVSLGGLTTGVAVSCELCHNGSWKRRLLSCETSSCFIIKRQNTKLPPVIRFVRSLESQVPWNFHVFLFQFRDIFHFSDGCLLRTWLWTTTSLFKWAENRAQVKNISNLATLTLGSKNKK